MATLLIKVGALVLKTLAKPLSSRFTAYVMDHPVARQHTINAAQRLHRFEVWLTRGAEGKTGRVFVADMTEEKSVELAAKLASEGFVFAVGMVILAFEYDRQRRKEMEKKALEQRQKMEMLERAKEERTRLMTENMEQQQLIESLLHRVDSLEENLQRLRDEAAAARHRRGWFGGMLGPRGLQAAGAP